GTGVGSACEPWRSCSGAFEETVDLAPPEGSDLVDGFQDRALGVLPADPDLFIAEAEDLQAVADGAQVTAPVAEEGILLLMMRTPVDLEEEAPTYTSMNPTPARWTCCSTWKPRRRSHRTTRVSEPESLAVDSA